MPDPRHALRRIAASPPPVTCRDAPRGRGAGRVLRRIRVAATRDGAVRPRISRSFPSSARSSAAGGMPVENRVTTVRIDPETADRQPPDRAHGAGRHRHPAAPADPGGGSRVAARPRLPSRRANQAASPSSRWHPRRAVPTCGGALAWPVPGGVITQYYHTGHLALDIAAPLGSKVIASAAGVVTWAGWRNNGGGYVVQVDHGNGIQTVYNHLNAIWVSPGQSVARGQGIARGRHDGRCHRPALPLRGHRQRRHRQPAALSLAARSLGPPRRPAWGGAYHFLTDVRRSRPHPRRGWRRRRRRLSFRREAHVPRGGPDGGDGGRGGDVVMVVEPGMTTLGDYVRARHHRAAPGAPGRRKAHGRNGAESCLRVPPGTVVRTIPMAPGSGAARA